MRLAAEPEVQWPKGDRIEFVGGAVSFKRRVRGSPSRGPAATFLTWNRRAQLTGIGLTLPALVFAFAFMVYPVANVVFLSFHQYSPLRSADTIDAGVSNYSWLASSDIVGHSIWVTVVFTFVSVGIEMAVGLTLATLLGKLVIESRHLLGRALSRVLLSSFILPFATPAIAGAIAWKMLLHPQFGPVDAILRTDIAWFSQFPLASIIVADAWKTMPFVLFLLFAAVLSIEPDQYEAARLDGANGWQEFRYITLPSIVPVLAVVAAFRAVDAFTKIFDVVFVTTGGGPGNDTQVFPLLIWRTAFDFLNFGQASALAVVAVLVSAALGASLLAIRRISPA
jgi:multiple sugar transport system permease protein